MRWPVRRLAEPIVSTYHAYVRLALPVIGRYLPRLVDVHGARHPELSRIAASFDQLGRGLLQHMLKEEEVLFPCLQALAGATGDPGPCPFGTVENLLRMMERERRDAGDEMRLIGN